MPGSYASGICSVCLLSFAPTRARNLRNHGPIDNRCCGLGKQPAQPRPQGDAHLLSQSATSIGPVVDSATVVLDAVPIPAASTGNRCYYRCKSQAQLLPQLDVHLSSQSTASIGHMVNWATTVLDVSLIPATSTGLLKKAPSWLQRFDH